MFDKEVDNRQMRLHVKGGSVLRHFSAESPIRCEQTAGEIRRSSSGAKSK